jgi:phosphoglycolate phosphatase
LVFDWDGTLMDSIASIVACTCAALADVDCGEPDELAIRRSVGLGLRECAEMFLPGAEESRLELVVERYRHHWLTTFKDRPTLFAGAADALRQLATAGHLLAIATGKGRRGLMREVERSGLEPLFGATRTVDECPSKPHPAMLLELMAELGAGPRETLMIGDTSHDLQMAANAGVAAVGLLTGTHHREELDRCRPLALLANSAEIPRWLASRSGAALDRPQVAEPPSGT